MTDGEVKDDRLMLGNRWKMVDDRSPRWATIAMHWGGITDDSWSDWRCQSQCTAQCAVCTVSFPRNRTRWDMTSHLTIVISFNIYFPQLVRLRGKHFYERFFELQTLNLWFSLNYTPVSTTEFWRFMPQFLSKYMGIPLSPRIIYRAILNTGGSYCTNSTLCTGEKLSLSNRVNLLNVVNSSM